MAVSTAAAVWIGSFRSSVYKIDHCTSLEGHFSPFLVLALLILGIFNLSSAVGQETTVLFRRRGRRSDDGSLLVLLPWYAP